MANARTLRFRKGFAVFWFDVVGVVSYAVVAVNSARRRLFDDEGGWLHAGRDMSGIGGWCCTGATAERDLAGQNSLHGMLLGVYNC